MPLYEYPRYDTKQSDSEVPVMMKLRRRRSTLSLPSLPGSLWAGVVASDRVLSIGQMKRCTYAKLNRLK